LNTSSITRGELTVFVIRPKLAGTEMSRLERGDIEPVRDRLVCRVGIADAVWTLRAAISLLRKPAIIIHSDR
jgi:hypothetical protein